MRRRDGEIPLPVDAPGEYAHSGSEDPMRRLLAALILALPACGGGEPAPPKAQSSGMVRVGNGPWVPVSGPPLPAAFMKAGAAADAGSM